MNRFTCMSFLYCLCKVDINRANMCMKQSHHVCPEFLYCIKKENKKDYLDKNRILQENTI